MTRRKRYAKPATSPKAKAAAEERRADLLAVLAARGAPVDRAKLLEVIATKQSAKVCGKTYTPKQAQARLAELQQGTYGKEAARYLAQFDDFAHKEAHAAEARHVPHEDLFQAARLGLAHALDLFDETKAGSFISYAVWQVKREIKLLLEQESLVKIPQSARQKAAELREKLGESLDTLTTEEAARTLLRLEGRKYDLRAKDRKVRNVQQHRSLYLGNDHTEFAPTREKEEKQGEHTQVVQYAIDTMLAVREEETQHAQRLDDLETAVEKLPSHLRDVLIVHFGLKLELSGQPPSSKLETELLKQSALEELRQQLTEQE